MKEVSIIFTGEAGTGIKTIEALIAPLLKNEGYNLYISKEIMSRVRGGNNVTQLRVSDKRVTAMSDKNDFVIVLSKNSLYRLDSRLQENTIIIGPKAFIEEKYSEKFKTIYVEFAESARQVGNIMYANSVILGFLGELLGITFENVEKLITKKFSKKGEEVISKNLEAYKAGENLAKESELKVEIEKDKSIISNGVVTGTEAMAIGSLAGGCNLAASYPMAPSTEIFMQLIDYSKDFDIATEQAEDEIAAINMVLGGWYAGARALTTTSGGGFALMCEGISMAGIGELPAVIHLAQRPGPGTGLPTRTEQGDLNLVLYAGHGDFPRVILAPGSLEEGVILGNKAFNIADKYQVPVFLLSDFHYVNQSYNISEIDFSKLKIENHFIKSGKGYERYKLTDSGISPRAIPGYGEGFVCVDSDEHDESGHITEDFDVRVAHNEKRNRKLSTYEDIEPVISGDFNYETLIIGWGSTWGAINEAFEKESKDKIAYAHFTQVYPIPKSAKSLIEKAKKVIIIENNYTGQFADLIKKELGINLENRVLRADGLPFTVEQIQKVIREI